MYLEMMRLLLMVIRKAVLHPPSALSIPGEGR